MPESLVPRRGGDGSFSLWSDTYREGFHSGRGALREARETFLAPSQLERFPPGARLKVVEVCVGTGTNLALLLEACAARDLDLEWWGLELDPKPLQLALGAEEFRHPWLPSTLQALEELLERGRWLSEGCRAHLLWGDARLTLGELLEHERGQIQLVWHDAFSPQRCPQLWTLEFLRDVTSLLAPEGRWISYSSAAAVRESLRRQGLSLAALANPESVQAEAGAVVGASPRSKVWSGGTVASLAGLEARSRAMGTGPEGSLQTVPLWRELTPMELDHLMSAAGEPYRDPSGTEEAERILANRLAAQAASFADGTCHSSSAWRRRWGVG